MSYNLGFSNQKNLYDDGELIDYDNWSQLQKLVPAIKELTISFPKIVSRKLFGVKSEPSHPRLDIDINFKNYQILLDDRARALATGVNANAQSVNGEVRFSGKKKKAKFRLKGDLFDHWTSKYRMSLRVDLKGSKTILGFNEFSLQKPLSRQHPYDQAFQSLMKRSGNLASAHEYVHVYVNGTDWGLMNMEEHVSKQFLEKQRVKDSIIVRFADEREWYYQENTDTPFEGYRISDPFLNVKLYGAKKSLRDDLRRKWMSYIAKERIEKKETLYDVEHHSRALILATIWNQSHVLGYNNSRYYFNPYTLKLEPITTDASQYSRLIKAAPTISIHDDIYVNLLSKKSFKDDFDRNFKAVKNASQYAKSDLEFYDSYFPINKKKTAETLRENLDFVDSNIDEFFFSVSFNHDLSNKPIQNELISEEQSKELLDHIYARHYSTGEIDIYNLLPIDVSIEKVLHNGRNVISSPITVPAYKTSSYEPQKTIFTNLRGIQDNKIELVTRLGVNERITNAGITLYKDNLYNPLLKETFNPELLVKSQDEKYDFLSGRHVIDKGIVIHGDLKIKSNTTLLFNDDAFLIVIGSIIAKGDTDKSIVLKALNKSWKGMYVLGGDSPSVLQNVLISDTHGLQEGLLNLTAGVTFYDTELDINKVSILNSMTEDGLNLVNTTFNISELNIENTISDAFDSDFSTGTIRNSTFSQISGDAIDFSGSEVDISNVYISKVKDKAVSVGEESNIIISNSKLENIGVGIASKDGSIVSANGIKISKYNLKAAMTYKKKSIFGAPKLVLNNSEIIIDGNPFTRQVGTSFIVDDVDIHEEKVDVNQLYDSEVMKK